MCLSYRHSAVSTRRWMQLGLVFLTVVLIEKSFAQGQDVGSGGNVVVCRAAPDAGNNFEGYYSLDYLLTYGGLRPVAAATYTESLARIGRLLKEKVPELYLSFNSFREDIFNTSYDYQHVWEPAPFGLITLDDQNTAVLLPPNCLEDGRIKVIQAVIRLNPDFSGTETQIFRYMPSVITTLEDGRALQASFLMVHEWLWELSRNVVRNRRVNRYLHSEDFARHTPAEALAQMRGMGLTLTGDRIAFESIQEAVDQAPPNATIRLLDRTYAGDVAVTKSLTFRPAGGIMDRPHIAGSLWVRADDVTLEGLSFGVDSSVRTEEKGLLIENCRFTGNGVLLSGSAESTLRNNLFENMFEGIDIKEFANVTVVNNRFVDIYQAISVYLSTEPDLAMAGEGIRIHGNEFIRSQVAIDAYLQWPSSDPPFGIEVSGNSFADCTSYCLWLQDLNARIFDNTFSGASEKALLLSDSDALVANNRFLNNETGVLVLGRQRTSTSIIRENSFVDNEVGLKTYTESPTFVVERNRFESNDIAIHLLRDQPLGSNTFVGNRVDVE